MAVVCNPCPPPILLCTVAVGTPCDRQLRSSPGDFLPFLEDVQEGEGFERYCVNVQESAEWGGQVELQVRIA